ncbi:hypothetical protein FZEAL_4596 [Fusarium zealandicum]|uniref:2EXR domain-containing protein n=1 Tax=Fusarium zealandicum TaxID=1053134 RepID=A0A8H4ULU3_9HYPO|nr:hypothetical protein FZEAL_4596 [Fusarium zealandicum]
MALTTFHLFPLLPLELREEIYILATPPRIVHIQEDCEQYYEEFEEKLRTKPHQTNLHPSLTAFAFNWRRYAPVDYHSDQQTLESFGFTGAKPLRPPWHPSASTPEIPIDWLVEFPELAWEFTREGFLYSRAPIPPLLHTCVESRCTLMRNGYKLAFRTRSSGPRTWFNFVRDTLFLAFEDDSPNILSGCVWDFGQFDPEEMQKVQKLALEYASRYLLPQWNANRCQDDLSQVLRLFNNLKGLFLVEWSSKDWTEWLEECGQYPGTAMPKPRPVMQKGFTRPEPWTSVAMGEVDVLLQNCPLELVWPCGAWPTSVSGSCLTKHKHENGASACYFDYMSTFLKDGLTEYRDNIVSNSTVDALTPWLIPQISVVHMLTRSHHELISEGRLKGLEYISGLQNEWADEVGAKLHPPTVDTAFENEYWHGLQDSRPATNTYEWDVEQQMSWWMQLGGVPTTGGDLPQ